MKLLIMCMTFLMLLCGAAQAEAPDIAFETDFEEVYRQLVDAQWLDAQSEIVTTALDQPEQSLKHAADSGEHYAELILTEDGLPFQYAFCGDWEKPESLRLCIEACLQGNTQGLTEALVSAYEASEDSAQREKNKEPSGTVVRGHVRLVLESDWLYLMNLDVLGPQNP